MRKLITVLLLLGALRSQGQSVGLVLSGGGARGLYHVGILKALEENSIPIDYIAGASMGAIVGGMYASGYSPDYMWEFFKTDSVSTWLSGKLPEEFSYFFKKYAPTPEMVSIDLNAGKEDITKALQLPTNLVSPYLLDLAFHRMITPASSAAADNFDNLMVPFRCVASDVFNKKLVVFKDGNLTFAIRASMSIPLVFKPMIMDTTLLYDGGVYNNFPWQSLDAYFQPDVYIGGVCARNYENPSQDNLVGQLSVMITQHTDYQLPRDTDVEIKHIFKDVTTLEYTKAEYIMQRGYDDAMAAMPQIKERIKRRVSPEEIVAKRAAFNAKKCELIYEGVQIMGLDPAQTHFVMRQLGIRDSQLISEAYFREKYLKIMATGIFTSEFPEVQFNPKSGFYRIILRMATQSDMKFSIGGNLSSTSLNQLYAGFRYRTVGRTASSYGVEAALGDYLSFVALNGRHDFYTRFPFYISYGAGVDVVDNDAKNARMYYSSKDWRAQQSIRYLVRGSFAANVSDNQTAFRAHLNLGKTRHKYFNSYYISTDTPTRLDFLYGSLTTELQKKTTNYAIYPISGVSQTISAKFTSGIEGYRAGSTQTFASNLDGKNRSWWEVNFQREQYLTLGRLVNLGYHIEGAASNHPKFSDPIATAFSQPTFAPTPLSKSIFMPEYRSNSYIAMGIMPILKFDAKNNFYLKAYLYGFLPEEFLVENRDFIAPTFERLAGYAKFIYGGSLVYQTPIGPASLTVTRFTTAPSNWNLVVNFGMMLFNK